MKYFVKIVRCDPLKWYSDRIGKTVEVRTAQPINTIIGKAYQSVEDHGYVVLVEDCIRVTKKN